MRFPKHQYIRSQTLLRNAREIPCQYCGSDDGTVVAAHTNWQGGKGRGIKADDNLIASLCNQCHMEIDQGKGLTKEERQKIWLYAHKETVRKLYLYGLWPNDVPLPEGL
jgi:hypothetical protein